MKVAELKEMAYLPLRLSGHRVEFGGGLQPVEPVPRRWLEASYAFLDAHEGGMDELYYMYRDVAWYEHRRATLQHGLRFDVTLIPAGFVGREYNKTVGHYHPVKAGTNVTYPEVYEVLHGEATYLLQRPGKAKGEVDDVVVTVARAGEKVVIPPGYGHITINAGTEVLVMANWVASEFSSVYGDIKELRGGAYYLVHDTGAASWLPNPRYTKSPPVRQVAAKDYPEYGLFKHVPMYKLIIDAPEKLRFLTHPEELE